MALFKTLIFTIVVPGTVTVGIPYLLLASGLGLSSYDLGGFRLLGVMVIALGVACYLACAWNFATVGKGTPAIIDPPRRLVLNGPYRVVRNPMYVGATLILLGEAVMLGSLTLLFYAVVVWTAFHLFVISFEELDLKHRFDGAYEEYCRAVPRWIPRLSRANRQPIGRAP